jgi:uncharacterized DUF497 family protein
VAGRTDIEYYFDPVTGQPHIYNHGVAEWEVEDILVTRIFDFPSRQGSRVALGQTSGGRYLKVIYTTSLAHERIFVITAYELRGKERKAFRRLRRRRLGKKK